MITGITNNYSLNSVQLRLKSNLNFAGDKDLLIINETKFDISLEKCLINEALGNEIDTFKIHEAIGGKEGIKKAKKYKPLITITAYHMPGFLKPHGEKLIKALKKLGTKVIVKTGAWQATDEELTKGAYKCENICGADKFVFDCHIQMFEEALKAIIDGKPIPKYHFQEENNNKTEENDK